MMIRSLRVLGSGLAMVGVLTLWTAAHAQDAPPAVRIDARIVDRIDDLRLAPLQGSTYPLARSTSDRGQVAPNLAMGDLFLVLRRAPEVQAAFDQFVTSQYDPKSPNFHQWLTADQIGERFGPAASDIQTLATWLSSHGFTVDEVSRDRVSIRFSGTAAQVQNTFHTEIHDLDVKGIPHIANRSDIQIPLALAPVVVGVRGLHNFFPHPLHRIGNRVTRNRQTGNWQRVSASNPDVALSNRLTTAASIRPKPLFGTTDAYGDVIEDVAPFDFATIYNVLPLWQQSTAIDGTGQKIAIAGTSNIVPADVAAFRTAFGLPTGAAANTPTVIITNSDPGTCPTFADSCSGDLVENTLDVEWAGAVAKGASILLVTSSAPTVSTDPLYLSESYIVQNNTAPIMNVSYGACEVALGTAGNAQYNSLWQTAAAEGISVIVAAGDAGSSQCDQGFDASYGVPYGAQFGRTVSGIASTPYNTAVGGTDFNWGTAAAPYWNTSNSATTTASATGYIPEVPWNSTCVNPLILPQLQADAGYIYAAPVTDAESACNFILNNFSSIYANFGVQLGGLVDTIGGGGGASNCISPTSTGYVSSCQGGYAKPSWQTGVTGIPADGVRDIPDVSFFASPGFLGSAYLICVSGGGATCTYSSTAEPSALEVGGTSVGAPAMAGVMALINQRTGANQGNPNGTLYKLASTQAYASCSSESAKASGACLFNDIDTGTNAMPCQAGSTTDCGVLFPLDSAGILTGYSAGAGFDLATGLGSLNVANVVNKWPLANAPLVTLSPSTLSFAATVQGYASATQAITLKNTGSSTLTISGIAFSGANPTSFTQTNTCGTSVAANATCTLSVTFKPTTTGALTASLTITDNAYTSPQTISLSGTGTAPAPSASLSADSINFGSTAVGASNSASVTLSNTGTAALSIASISFTGTNATSFSYSSACGAALAAGSSCIIGITFTPTLAGSLVATFTIADNAANSPQTIALTGTATGSAAPAVSITPGSLTFPSTAVGAVSAIQPITIKNNSSSAVTLSGIAFTGTNASSFLRTSTTCTNPLAAGASCISYIEFVPTTSEALTATLTLSSSAPAVSIPLSGTGAATAAITLTPGSLTFPSTTVGSASATQPVTIKNNSSSAVTLSGIAFTGTNASSFLRTSTTCVNPLGAGASCISYIEFVPTTSGALSATLTLSSSAPAVSIPLSGTGAAILTLSLTPGSLTFPSTAVGSASNTQPITIKNTGTSAVTLNGIAFSGAGASSFVRTSTTCVNPLAAGDTCTSYIEFQPTTTGALTATLTLNSNAANSPQTIALSGTGQ
jgi:hypothetical protein